MRTRVPVLGSIVVLSLVPVHALSHSAPLSFEELAEDAGRVYVATVERVECLPMDGPVGVQTVATLGAVEWVAASASDRARTSRSLRWVGGTWGERSVESCMTPRLTPGERYVFFEEATGGSVDLLRATPFLGASQGLWRVENVGGRAVVRTASGQFVEAAPDGMLKAVSTSVEALDEKAFCAAIVAARGNTDASADAGESPVPSTPAGVVPQPLIVTGPVTKGTTGGATGWCGNQTLPIVFELSEDPFSRGQNEELLAHYNQFMDIYRIRTNNGPYAFRNGRNEYHGELNDTDYRAAFESDWGASTLAVCWTLREPGEAPCRRLVETDIAVNANFNFTANHFDQWTNNTVYSFRAVMNHEFGHSWGNQTGTFVETYDYPVPTVMHAGYRLLDSRVWETGFGLQPNDVQFLRQAYGSQTPVINIRDVGVESYRANGGLYGGEVTPPTLIADEYSQSLSYDALTVVNNGTAAENDVRVRFFLSTDFNITPADYLIGTLTVASLGAESFQELSFSTTVPGSVPPGTYFTGAIVSRNGLATDDYEGNNTTLYSQRITVTQPPDDEFEPNDSREAARLVASGIVGSRTLRLYNEDWFAFDVSGTDDSVDVKLLPRPGSAPFQLELYDSAGTLVDTSSPTDLQTFVWALSGGAGRYYVRVYESSYTGRGYDLVFYGFNSQQDDRDEPNDNALEARAIAARDQNKWLSTTLGGPLVQADADWYSFDVAEGANSLLALKFQLDFNGRTTMELYDANLTRIATATQTQGGGVDDGGYEAIQLQGTVVPGRYHLLVSGTDEYTRYDIKVETFSREARQPEEPNNVAVDAFDVAWIGAQFTGEILPPFVQTDVDFFLVRLTEGQNAISGYLRPLTAGKGGTTPGGLEMTLLDEDGNVLATSYDIGGWQELPSTEGLPPGNYYLRVTGDNSGTPYDIIWYPAFIAPPSPGDFWMAF
ncbi:hypothetical protein GC173_07370 [bacterium]|nr:hypothetical protein [bacterium]